MTSNGSKWGVVCLTGALLLLIVLGPIQSAIWNGPETPGWIARLTWLHQTASRLQAAIPAWAGMHPYDAFGRLMAIVYAGALVGLAGLSPGSQPISQRMKQVALVTLGIAAVADVVSYWTAGFENDGLRFWSFWVTEMPALVLTLLAVSTLGILRLRAGYAPGWANWPLALVLPLALALTAALQYMPHGPMTALCAALLIAYAATSPQSA